MQYYGVSIILADLDLYTYLIDFNYHLTVVDTQSKGFCQIIY